MSSNRTNYDIALVKQAVCDGGDGMIDRVVRVLRPGVGRIDDRMRRIARTLINALFKSGRIVICPACGADFDHSKNVCRPDRCPFTESS